MRVTLASAVPRTALSPRPRLVNRPAHARLVAAAAALVLSAAPSALGATSVGPTAKCRDGTYSYSHHRRGTCSYHNGVARWLRNVPA
jgi:hypothetical protein